MERNGDALQRLRMTMTCGMPAPQGRRTQNNSQTNQFSRIAGLEIKLKSGMIFVIPFSIVPLQ